MLPSTGYFKGINCPFYDSGLCERPYCHFRHVKKETQNTSSDRIESGAIFHKLVSAAVQKVLQQTDVTSVTTNNVSPPNIIENKNTTQPSSKATYNPTPISELKKINNADSEISEEVVEQKKKHIPVPYTPRRPTTTLPINTKNFESTGSTKPIYIQLKYTPGVTETSSLDPYTPKGSTESTEEYLPGSEVEHQKYKPKETTTTGKHDYVPSDKSNNKSKKILEYKPTMVSSNVEPAPVTYQPTLKALVPCFSSDEDEPENKKRKVSISNDLEATTDLNGLDDLGPEFDILDQILDEETPKLHKKKKENIEKPVVVKENSNKEEKKHNDKSSKRSSKSSKHDKKSHESKKHKSNDNDSNKKDKHLSKNSSKSNHSSNKLKETESKSDKRSSSSGSKSSHHSSRKSEKKVSKKSDGPSKHSSSSSKSKEKSSRKSSHKKEFKSNQKKSSREKYKEHNDNIISNDNTNHFDDALDAVENEEELYSSESDEETIALECKRIFEEYVPLEKSAITQESHDKNNTSQDLQENEYVPGKKRISRTVGKDIKVVPRGPAKPNFKIRAAQTMTERLAKVREYHALRNNTEEPHPETIQTKQEAVKPFSNVNSGNATATKIRIAHVPYASTLVSAKKSIPPSSNKQESCTPSTSSTIVQTIKKGQQRTAHIPNEKFIDRPGVLEPLASKIAANIRSIYLNMMIDECLKIYLSATDAYARAQHEELTTSKKCSTVQIYKNSAVLTVSRLRKELLECNGVKKSGTDCSALQKVPNSVTGSSGQTGSWSIESKNRKVYDNNQEFSGSKFYKNIMKWLLTEELLQENGFPRPHASGEKGRATIYGQNRQNPPKGFLRTCSRCKMEYTVDKKGFPAVKKECIYHPNRKYRVRGDVRYQCCSQDGTSDGCCVAPCHVYEYVDYDNLKGYVKTLPPESFKDDYGVYSLDCEMCYTTQGLDLTRVTVINSNCKVVYETLIKPLHPIIDYNTRYSGITEEQMSDVKTTLLDVQATLLTMFSSKTILIGHSLESDFKALKMIHDTVIDTSVLFPHKMGPPFKRALRNLSSEYLKKIIQNSVEGHDSAEDATVCMELIIYKLKEDLKTR